jgi:hypothetical protein
MSIIDWVLLGGFIIEAIAIPVAFLNGFKAGMLIQYEKKEGLPPIVPYATFGKTVVVQPPPNDPLAEDPYYTETNR